MTRSVSLPSDPIRCSVCGDLEQLVHKALRIPPANHFGAHGTRDLRKWFHPAARTREPSVLEVGDVIGHQGGIVVACGLDDVARRPVESFVVKAGRMGCRRSPYWPGSDLWHWWLCSDEQLLVWFDDWPSRVFVDPSLGLWVDEMIAGDLLVLRTVDPPA